MNVAYERLVRHLEEHDVKYRSNEDTRVVSADFQGEVGTYRLMATVDEDGELFQVLAMSPGRDDVIHHDQQSCCLRDWIVVCDGDTTECPSDVPTDVPANVPADVPAAPANVPARPTLNQRQEWFLEQLERGVAVPRIMVEDQFGVGDKTAKRDLSELVREGLVVFVRRGRDGYYGPRTPDRRP